MQFIEIINRIVEGEIPESTLFNISPSEREIDLALNKLEIISDNHKNYACVLALFGRLSFEKTQYQLAIDYFEQAIVLGNANAMTLRALLHQSALGGPQNYAEAIRLYEQAIVLKNTCAMTYRALMHQHGLGGPQNFFEAKSLYDQAIELGEVCAMLHRGLMFLTGNGTHVHYPKAIRLFDQAIFLGNTCAMTYRALMHHYGLGGYRDYAKAASLYFQVFCLNTAKVIPADLMEMATQQNIPIAQYYLILAYLKTSQNQEAQVLYLANSQRLVSVFLEKM